MDDLHLVVGASGQVGSHLLEALRHRNLPSAGTFKSFSQPGLIQLNVCDNDQVWEVIKKLQPSVIYLPAAIGNADYCELHPKESYATNVFGVVNFVKTAAKIGAKVVYFSSDYVFDGKEGPYLEDDPANPICEYGRQKVSAEHYLLLNSPNVLIVRTTVVYGWEKQGKNFIERLCKTLRSCQTLKAPIDQIGSPTYALDLARATIELVSLQACGIYNVVGPQLMNRYEFACEAAKLFSLDSDLIEPVTTNDLKQIAPRPLKAGMRTDKLNGLLHTPMSNPHDGLRKMVETEGKDAN